MEKWKNCTAVITGANSGIGFSILQTLLDNGMKVVGLDLNIEEIEKLKDKNKEKEIYPKICDITSDEQAESAFKWIDDNLGGCQILVNNAGMLRNNGILDYEKSMKEVELNVNINFTSVVRCSRLAFKSMDENESYGYIININSVCGLSVAPIMKNGSAGVYNGTKYAVTATAEVMRHELNMMDNRKVRVTNISPGVIKTNLYNESRVKTDDLLDSCKGPILVPKDISDAVMYLLSTPYEVNVTNITLRATGAGL